MSDQTKMAARTTLRRASESTIVLLSLTAWFLLSNHCALGVISSSAEAASPEAGGCPMHSAPAKKKPATKIPCCKDVRAIVGKTVKAAASAARIIGAQTFATEIVAPPVRLPTRIELLDTGPPGWVSFAESVLQESLLAHAPPVS